MYDTSRCASPYLAAQDLKYRGRTSYLDVRYQPGRPSVLSSGQLLARAIEAEERGHTWSAERYFDRAVEQERYELG